MSEKRTYNTKSISDIAGKIDNQAFRRFGFAKRDILIHWSNIVGPVLARSSMPERLIMPKNENHNKAGILHIRIEGSFAPEMQHLEPLVIDRINAHYGFKAVEKLIFHHGFVENKIEQKKYQPPILNDSQKKELDTLLAGIKDDHLRESLYKVGFELMGTKNDPKTKQIKHFQRRGQGGLEGLES